jgi:aminoglycoside phosphotransferase (APT) family kinase protein
MPSIGWLSDASEGTLRAALASAIPRLAGLPIRINPRHAQSNPTYWSASAVIDDAFVVKYSWSEVRATRLWREGVVLRRLRERDVTLALPELVALTRDPALLVTRLVAGEPLSWEWASGLSGSDIQQVGAQLAQFLARLHAVNAAELLGDLPVVHPTPQADTERLRRRFPRLVDERRGAAVLRWCHWVDEVLDTPEAGGDVVGHGDFHGYNQVWDRVTSVLRAVVDFEESGLADPHFDLRYLPGNARGPELLHSVMNVYASLTGRRLSVGRVLAWSVLTHLGDAMWRTEAGVPLPGGGTAASWVDDLELRLAAFDLA